VIVHILVVFWVQSCESKTYFGCSHLYGLSHFFGMGAGARDVIVHILVVFWVQSRWGYPAWTGFTDMAIAVDGD
jgi:hypothetical protein